MLVGRQNQAFVRLNSDPTARAPLRVINPR
jgi:hypothetical protein